MPLSERVVDKLADILFASDEILDIVEFRDTMPTPVTVEVQESVRLVYDQVNELMKKLTD